MYGQIVQTFISQCEQMGEDGVDNDVSQSAINKGDTERCFRDSRRHCPTIHHYQNTATNPSQPWQHPRSTNSSLFQFEEAGEEGRGGELVIKAGW